MTDAYRKGLHELGRGCWAWLQPDGGWGWSNAGLVTDGDRSLLVDTLYDLKMTGDMLAAMRRATPAAVRVDVLVNSHADGDHTYGNRLVESARIIASRATADEFFRLPPQKMQSIVDNAESLGPGAQYIAAWVRDHGFEHRDIDFVGPTETYERELTLKVGDKTVHLFDLGPAHTAGDTLVHSVDDRVVFTGDLLFLGVHPAIWEGSIEGWRNACDRMLALEIDVVVPGHGPLTDKAGVRLFQRYLDMIERESRTRFEAGMTVDEAAADIHFEPPFDEWLVPERVAGSVNFLFRQWGSPQAHRDFMKVFELMARYADADQRTKGSLR